MGEGMGQPGQWLLTATEKVLVFCSGHSVPTFFS